MQGNVAMPKYYYHNYNTVTLLCDIKEDYVNYARWCD